MKSAWIDYMTMSYLRSLVRRLAKALLPIGLGLSVAACGSGPAPVPGAVQSVPSAALGQEDYDNALQSNYVLRPADIISVNVFREEQLSLPEVTVGADGRISLPLIGAVQVGGLTPSEFAVQVERALGARYLTNPAVAVNVVSYGSHLVTVEGAVKEAGVYQFVPGTRLSGGISLAQGPDRVAKLSEVVVFRDSPDGRSVARFDYQAVRSGTMIDPVLEPGDRIVVGTDSLNAFWQDFLKVVPLIGLFVRF